MKEETKNSMKKYLNSISCSEFNIQLGIKLIIKGMLENEQTRKND